MNGVTERVSGSVGDTGRISGPLPITQTQLT